MTVAAVPLAVALLALVGAHIGLVVGLARRALWRAPFSVLVPPLAPYWGWQRGMRRRALVWWLAVLVYALSLAALAVR